MGVNPKTEDSCDSKDKGSGDCNTCDSKAECNTVLDKMSEPNVLEFMWGQTISTFHMTIDFIVSFIKNIISIVTAPWGLSGAGLICNEVLFEYFEACKKEEIPYLEPPGFILQGVFAQFGNRKSGFKARIESKVRKKYGRLFKFKMMILPFHYKGLAGIARKAFIKETMTYNGQYHNAILVNDEEAKKKLQVIFDKAAKLLMNMTKQEAE